ncbi:MAG: hypothetical protein V1921_06005 [Candidatus Altiarchaeota archaeon]
MADTKAVQGGKPQEQPKPAEAPKPTFKELPGVRADFISPFSQTLNALESALTFEGKYLLTLGDQTDIKGLLTGLKAAGLDFKPKGIFSIGPDYRKLLKQGTGELDDRLRNTFEAKGLQMAPSSMVKMVNPKTWAVRGKGGELYYIQDAEKQLNIIDSTFGIKRESPESWTMTTPGRQTLNLKRDGSRFMIQTSEEKPRSLGWQLTAKENPKDQSKVDVYSDSISLSEAFKGAMNVPGNVNNLIKAVNTLRDPKNKERVLQILKPKEPEKKEEPPEKAEAGGVPTEEPAEKKAEAKVAPKPTEKEEMQYPVYAGAIDDAGRHQKMVASLQEKCKSDGENVRVSRDEIKLMLELMYTYARLEGKKPLGYAPVILEP